MDSAGALRERHAGQMAAYRKALAQIFSEAEIELWLLSTKLEAWLEA